MNKKDNKNQEMDYLRFMMRYDDWVSKLNRIVLYSNATLSLHILEEQKRSLVKIYA